MRDLAQLYLVTGRADGARNLYNQLVGKDPNESNSLLGLADTYIAKQKWTEAIDAINRARTAAPNDPAPGLKLVGVYAKRQDWTNAKTIAAQLAAQFPGNADILDTQGQAQLAAGDTNSAVSSFKRAYVLAPNSAPILSRYLAALNGAKYFTEARGVLQEAVARNPQNASLKTDLIRAEGEVSGVDTAVAKAHALATADPENSVYDLVSAEHYEKAGRIPDAVAVLEKAAAAKPSDEDLTIALARLYYRSGDFSKAEDVLVPRLKADPSNRAICTAMAQQYWATGRADDAKKLFGDLIAREPNDVSALFGLAEIATAERNWPAAAGYLDRARAAAPNDPAPGVALINLALARQDLKKAVATANQIAEQFPANFEVLDAKARAQAAAGDNEGATATDKLLYGLFPNSVPAMSSYVARLKEAKQFSEAQSVLQAVLAPDPKNATVKAGLIRMEADIGGMRAGLAKAREFAKDDPSNPLYDIVSAELYEKAERKDDAVDLLKTAVTAHPADDTLVAGLSALYARIGEAGKAEAALNTRLQSDPKDVTIRSASAALYLEQKEIR
jgi:predicted Zn-dependent protease